MAKKLLTTYTFTPGAANASTVVVPGTYALEQFLLVTNVTTGATIYQFNKPTKGGTVSTGGGNTTLTLEADTSSMSSSDRLQVFIDDATTGTSVNVSNTVSVTGPLTDAQLRATAVPVSGTVTATGPLTDTQLRASAVPVSAASLPLPSGAATSANQTTTNTSLSSIDGKLPALDTGSVPVLVKNGQLEITNDTGNPLPVGPAATLALSGSASALNADLFSVDCSAYRGINLQFLGTWVGAISLQVSNDNSNWVNIALQPSTGGTAWVQTFTANAAYSGSLFGFNFFRARFTSYTSGTATVAGFLLRENLPQSTTSAGASVTINANANAPGNVLYTVNSAATTNAASIKATSANVYGLSVMNTSAATKYVRLFNLTTAPTVGTSVPIMVVAVPATSSKEIGFVPALRFGTGLSVAITGGAAATDATAVAAGDVQLLVSYA